MVNTLKKVARYAHVAVSFVPGLASIALLALFVVWRAQGSATLDNTASSRVAASLFTASFYSVPTWLVSWTAAAQLLRSRSQLTLALLYLAGWTVVVGTLWLTPSGFSAWFLD